MKILSISLFLVAAGLFISHVPSVAHAQDLGGGLAIPGSEYINSDISKEPFSTTVVKMVNYFLGFLGLAATLSFIYAGVLWVVSGGDEGSIGKAKKIMTYASLGIVVVILSYSVVSFIAGSAGTSKTPGPLGPNSGKKGCQSSAECDRGQICSDTGEIENKCIPNPKIGLLCKVKTDCPPTQECNIRTGECETPTTPGPRPPGSNPSDPSVAAYEKRINALEKALSELAGKFQSFLDLMKTNPLADPTKVKVDEVIKLAEKEKTPADKADATIEGLKKLLDDPKISEKEKETIRALITVIERLLILRAELDDLLLTLPESAAIKKAYTEASDALNELISNPTDGVKYNRFDTKYKVLKQLLKDFPFVKSVIWATPGSGNVPFTVQLDGLDSVDPTGGTISSYAWSLLGSSGEEVSLGTGPVIVHDFTEANTYAVMLRVSTANKDTEGNKAAGDGISTLRIKALPPTSQVRFRINGKDTGDIVNITYKEAQAGLSFDPSLTTAAVGRKIEKYDWSFGDGATETRNVPTTVVHTYEKPGEYNIKLAVTDNIGVTDKKLIRLFVKSIAADIIISPPNGDVNTTFSFQGVASRSDDGSIQNYQWEIDNSDGKIIKQSDQKSFSFKFGKPGTYIIVITVTDVAGSKDRFTKTITISSRPPIANFMYTTPQKNHPNRVEFNAIESYDPDEGDSIKYSWDFNGDGVFESLDGKDAVISHDFDKVGEYRVKLQVTDIFGQYSQIEKTVSIDSILSGDIVSDKRAGQVGQPIEFKADSPNAVAYLWEFGDGETQSTSETTATHTYQKVGKFTVKLNFFDKDDNSNSVTQHVLVGAGGEPVAAIDYSVDGLAPNFIEDLCKAKDGSKEGVVVNRADNIKFDARNSINTDGSSRMLTYDWKFPGGEKSSNKESQFKFDDINKEGECFSASLVVRDQVSGKLSQPDEVYFKVINELPQITDFVVAPPTAAEQLITPLKVQLSVVNPRDNDGSIKKYRWWYFREGFADDKLGVNSTSAPLTDMTITSFGEPDTVNKYFFVVEVVDNDNGVYDSTERFGEVSYLEVKNGPNISPVTDFSVDKTTISVSDSISFSSKSYDPQGETLPNDAFRWDFDGDGEFDDVTSGPQVSRQFNTPGEYKVRLKVVFRGLSSSAEKTIFVESTQTLPQAAFTYSVEGNEVTFDASNSRFDSSLTDKTLRYEWDFDVAADANGNSIKDDDVQSTDERTSYTYSAKGIYKVKLTAKDMLGSVGVVVREVNLNLTQAELQKNSFNSLKVSSPKYAITTLDIEVVPDNLQKGGSADINARVLNADGTPYNGKVFFEITDGSGQFTPNPVTASESRASSVFTATDAGKVRIKVRATDTIHGELTEEATINVK